MPTRQPAVWFLTHRFRDHPPIQFITPATPAEWDQRALSSKYARSLGVDLCFQNFEAELDGLPGDYAGTARRVAAGAGRRTGRRLLPPLRRRGLPQRERNEAAVRAAGVSGASAARTPARIACCWTPWSDMEAARALYGPGLRGDPALLPQPPAGAHYLKVDLRGFGPTRWSPCPPTGLGADMALAPDGPASRFYVFGDRRTSPGLAPTASLTSNLPAPSMFRLATLPS